MGESNTNGYLLPDKAYQALKWLALIALPAVAWLVGAVGPQWGLPHCGEIVTTINAGRLVRRRSDRREPAHGSQAGRFRRIKNHCHRFGGNT